MVSDERRGDAILIAGGVLSGLSLLAVVVDAWARHFFFAAFHLARAAALDATGSFDPGSYAAGTARLFVGTRVLMWLLLAVGIGLLVWGAVDVYRDGRSERQP